MKYYIKGMEKNCILTRIDAVIDNDNLLRLGCFDLYVVNAHSWGPFLACSFKEDYSVMNIVNEEDGANASFSENEIVKERTYSGTTSVVNPQGYVGFRTNGKCTIRFTNASNMTGIRVNADATVGWTQMSNLFNLEDLIITDGSHMEDFPITNLCQFTNLKYFVITYNSYVVVGKLEDMIAGLVKNGRTTENDGITFKSGIKVTYGSHAFSDAFIGLLKWENATKSSYSEINGSTLYCIGYSDEEITENTESGGIWYGKTVIQV